MDEDKKFVKTSEERKQLEKEGYEVSAMTYWEGTPDSFEYHMVKKKAKKTRLIMLNTKH